MKKILISVIVWITIIWMPLTHSWLSFVDKVNSKNSEYRNKVIYILSDIISQINKDDIKFWPFKVLRVLDWDTFEIDYFWEKEKVRVYLIHTPERKEVWYEQANKFARDLLIWEEIYIKRIDKDRGSFWRLLREVYINDINYWDLMLQKWYAKLY